MGKKKTLGRRVETLGLESYFDKTRQVKSKQFFFKRHSDFEKYNLSCWKKLHLSTPQISRYLF